MSEKDEGQHPDQDRVEQVGNTVVVVTPCCRAGVLLRPDEVEPGAVLEPVCPRDGVGWLLQLVIDQAAASGLRAVWSVPHTP